MFCFCMHRSYRQVWFWAKMFLTESVFQVKWFYFRRQLLAQWFYTPLYHRWGVEVYDNSIFWPNHDNLSLLNGLIGWIPWIPQKFPAWDESTVTDQIALWFFQKLVRVSSLECLRDTMTFLKEWKILPL